MGACAFAVAFLLRWQLHPEQEPGAWLGLPVAVSVFPDWMAYSSLSPPGQDGLQPSTGAGMCGFGSGEFTGKKALTGC